MKKILVATEKPFAAAAVEGIKQACEKANYELVLLEKYTDKQDLLDAVKDVDALIIRSDKVTDEVIAAANNLKIVVRAGAGYDNVNLEAASTKNVVVMNTPGQNSNAVAELVMGMLLYMARNKFTPKAGTELFGKTIGLHAYGNVSKHVARIAKGLGMNVMAYDPFVCNCKMEEDGVVAVDNVDDLYTQCDYISLHMPLIEQTKAFVNYERFIMLKKGATIVNSARKEVVCEEGLLKALAERDDIKYVSDIPPVKTEELMEKYPNQCLFNPKKMGAQTKEANVNAGIAAINQIIDFIENGNTTFQVNK